jgi:CPA2 family monovalent cation:H+ antiporter-2
LHPDLSNRVHDLSLIATIAAAFTAAWVLGLLTQWLRLSPIVGYLLAGVLIGPHTPGFVGDVHIAQQLAEVGVILLMFGVGLHFHLKDLVAVRRIAIPGAVGQSLIATVLAVAVFSLFGMPVKTGAVLGMAMAVASTVVLMRVLMDADVLNSPQGHVAVGWLIVEDIFTVILLVLIPVLGADQTTTGGSGFWWALGIAMVKLAVLVAIVLWAGSKIVPWVLVRVAKLRSRELFTLTVLVFSVAIAAASYFFFGASMALGAFLAGMVVAQSPVSHQAAADALPMRDTFAVLFFVSVGMLFDPSILVEQPLMVAAALGIILVAKPLAALVIVAVLGHSARTALTVAIGLAQIGEFSFILSDLARRHGLMPDAGHSVLVASAILSITLNPLLFKALPKTEAWLRQRPKLWSLLNRRAERRVAAELAKSPAPEKPGAGKQFAIIVGYGPVGRSVHSVLRDAGVEAVVVDMNMDTVSQLRAEGQPVIFGDASNLTILEQAGTARASHLVITLPDAIQRAAIVTAARSLSETLRIVVRARYLRERPELERSGATSAIFEEAEAAVSMARMVLADTGQHHEAAERKLRDIRLQLIMDNVSNIRSQRLATVMVPWARVQTLCSADPYTTVIDQIARQRFSRWPVVDTETRRPLGYLLAKDLISYTGENQWPGLMRPLRSIHPDESISAALARMQDENVSLFVVEMDDMVLGMITMEDILEQVVGRLDDETQRENPVSLADALRRGAILADLAATSREKAIRELANAIPRKHLPIGMDLLEVCELALRREEEISTNLGNGIAVPHARLAGLGAPIVIAGRSREGIVDVTGNSERIHLFFLLVTPAERPETQLTLLSGIARSAASESVRNGLIEAASSVEFADRLHKLWQVT